MKVGDLVKFKDFSKVYDSGIVVEKKGRKWVRVAWPNGLITEEHIRDIKAMWEYESGGSGKVRGE